MNYIEAFKSKFQRLPTEKEIGFLMVAVAEEDQMNSQTRANRFMRNGFVATTYQECRGEE